MHTLKRLKLFFQTSCPIFFVNSILKTYSTQALTLDTKGPSFIDFIITISPSYSPNAIVLMTVLKKYHKLGAPVCKENSQGNGR